MYDEALLTVQGQSAEPVERASLSELDLQERAHLQEWLLANPAILGAGAEIITSEYDRWQTATGDPVLDRLDILSVGRDGRLIVVELKRGPAPHTVHMQAINYAAMVSRLTPQDIAELHAASRTKNGHSTDAESALTLLTTEFLLTSETIRSPRIVLVASDFPPAVTASVVWLNEQKVDVSLIRFRPYQLAGGQLVVSFSRLFPVPDVEEFTIGRRLEGPTADADSGAAWDEPSLRRLADQANPTTLALLDLTAAQQPSEIGVKEIAAHAGVSLGAVRGQLAGLTMRLNNLANGFDQNAWPATVQWLPGGIARYTMDPELAEIWRRIREQPTPSLDTQPT